MYEDRDWIMRQIKQISDGFGQMVTKETLKDFIRINQGETAGISDEELDQMIVIISATRHAKEKGLTAAALDQKFNWTKGRWQFIQDQIDKLSDKELKQLEKFINE